jgi:hypothetical protein
MPNPDVDVLKKETYIKMIENSVGSNMFNSVYVKNKDSSGVTDVLENGKYSCAYYVSSLLFLLGLIDRPHALVSTVKTVISTSGDWEVADKAEAGDVVFWNKVTFEDGTENAHVGFALNNQEAVSTSSTQKTVVKHSISLQGVDVVFRRKSF